MTIHPLRRLGAILLAASAFAAVAPAAAQDGTVRIVVGYPAGATSDALARVLAEHMQKTLKQNVIVENKVGAAEATELLRIARAVRPGIVGK